MVFLLLFYGELLLMMIGLSLAFTISKQPQSLALESPDPIKSLPDLGDPCETNCSQSSHAICRNSTCVCDKTFPVDVKEKKTCFKAILLEEDCTEDEQCKYHDQNAICKKFSRHYTECTCIHEYVIREIKGLLPPKVCFPGPDLMKKDIPTLLGLGLGLSLMSALLCLVMRLFAKARFARPRRYANAAIPPPLTVSEIRKGRRHTTIGLTQDYLALVPLRPTSNNVHRANRGPQRTRFASLPEDLKETYAAFALAAAETDSNSPIRTQGVRSAGPSRRTSYASLQHQRSGNLLRLSSASSLAHHRSSSAKRPSANSMRLSRSQTGLVLPSDSRLDRDHYILYMIRAPTYSVTSEATTSTNCDSTSSPRTPKSTDQILAVYHAVPEHSLMDMGIGPSHTTSTFKTISSEDVFQEEEEEDFDKEFEETEKKKNAQENRKDKKETPDNDDNHENVL